SQAYARRVQAQAIAVPQPRTFAVTGIGLEGWRPFGIAAAAAVLVSVLFVEWTANRWISDEATIALDDIGEAVAALIAAGSCALGLGKVYESSSATPAAQVIGLAYPVGDIVIATVLVVALRRARRAEVGRLALLLGGLAFNALADSSFAYLTANGTYSAIGSVLDAGWVIGYLMIALAPLWPARAADEVRTEGPIELWQLALPWVAVLS